MISTHILDTTKGMPASGVTVVLEMMDQNKSWVVLKKDQTNQDGRVSFDIENKPGKYQLIFKIEDYFKNQESFFLDTTVAFNITNINRKYHVPLLLNPYGYSTYRGS